MALVKRVNVEILNENKILFFCKCKNNPMRYSFLILCRADLQKQISLKLDLHLS